MRQKPPKRSHPGRKGHALTMHGVSPEDALRAVLSIKPEDVAKIRAEEAKLATPKGKRKGK